MTGFFKGFNIDTNLNLNYFKDETYDIFHSDEFFLLKTCYICSYVCNSKNSTQINGNYICLKCKNKKYGIGYSNKPKNNNLGTVSYIDKTGTKYIGYINKNEQIVYNDIIYEKTNDWINIIDTLNKV